MAIIFAENISTTRWNNGYNNNVVRFRSDLPRTPSKCTITVTHEANAVPHTIEITPILGGFRFNFKNLFKIISYDGFIDGFGYHDKDIIDRTHGLLTVVYRVVFMDSTADQATVVYPFMKRVQQVAGEPPLLTTPTVLNGDIVMWDDFPIDIFCLGFTPPVTITGSGVLVLTEPFNRIPLGVFPKQSASTLRFITQGFSIEPNCVVEPEMIPVGRSVLTLSSAAGVAALNIERRVSCGGQYVKWFNTDRGCWSYWMFSPVYRDNLSVKTKISFERDNASLPNSQHTQFVTGKNTEQERVLHTEDLTDSEKALLNTLLVSPKVELWGNGLFISALLADGMFETQNTKRATHRLQITIKLKHYSY